MSALAPGTGVDEEVTAAKAALEPVQQTHAAVVQDAQSAGVDVSEARRFASDMLREANVRQAPGVANAVWAVERKRLILDAETSVLRDMLAVKQSELAEFNAPLTDPVLDALWNQSVFTESRFTRRGPGALRANELAPALSLTLGTGLAYSPDLDTRAYQWGWLVGEDLRRPADVGLLISGVAFPALVDLRERVAGAEPERKLTESALRVGLDRFSESAWIQGQAWNGYRMLFGALKAQSSIVVGFDARRGAFARWLLSLPLTPTERPALWSAYSAAGFPGGLRGGRNASVTELGDVLVDWNGGPLVRSANNPVVPLDDAAFRVRVEADADVVR